MNNTLPMASKKPFLLRLPPELWEELNRWARDELRSVNGQIEFLLRQAVVKRRGEEEQKRKEKREKRKKGGPEVSPGASEAWQADFD